MPSRVTPYLGGTGQDNRGKMNVHPSLNRVSFGADVFASANVQVFGNSYSNTSEAARTNFQSLNVFQSTGSAVANVYSYASGNTSRFDIGVVNNVFSVITSAVGTTPSVQLTTGSPVSNVFFDFDQLWFRNRGGATRGLWNNTGFAIGTATINTGNIMAVLGNVYIDGNVFVTGTTTLVNSVVVSETANAYTANAYFLTKFSSNINPSNGVSFLNSNVALFSYGRTPVELDSTGGILLVGNNYIAANGSIGIGTRETSGANLRILSSSGVIGKFQRAGGSGDLDVSFTGIGNGDGITWQYSPASAASPTHGYQFLTADGARRVQAVTINRFGNVSIGDQTLNMANLSVRGNAFVSTTMKATNVSAGSGVVTPMGSLHVAGNGGVIVSQVGDASAYDSIRGWFTGGSSNPTFTWDTLSAPGSGTVETWMRWRNNNNGGNNNFGLLVDGRIKAGYNGTLPAANLEVVGNAYVSGNTQVDGHFAVGSPVVTQYSTFGTTQGILANNLSSDNKFESRRAGGQTWSLQHDTSQVYTWMNSKKGILQTNAGLVQIYGNDILALASNARGDVSFSGNTSAVNQIASNAIITSTGSFSNGFETGYITIASTGFFSATTSGQFLFRNSAQTKGGFIDVATTNANAFTFLHMSGAYANTYANVVTALGNLVVASNATIGNNFISESAAAFGSKSTGGANLFVMGSTYLQNRAGQDGNEVFQMRTSSGTVGAQHAVYSGNYDIATGSGFDINLSSGKGINPSWAGNNGMFFKGGTTVKHAMDNTKLAIGYTTVQASNLQVQGNAYFTTDLGLGGNLTAISKSFVINHPTREGMKLQYASLEGPEHGVYIRGYSNTSIVALPDYWAGLVDANSVTIHLTSVGKYQKLYLKESNATHFSVGNKSWFSGMEFHYVVHGTRKDIAELKVEY